MWRGSDLLERGAGVAYSPDMANWWDGHPEQRYWMEMLTRVGDDELFAPRSGQWAHELVKYVQPGDVVLHWRSGVGFVGTSVAVSHAGVESRVWAGVRQECWVVPLGEFEEFDDPVSLAEVRAVSSQIVATKAVLTNAYPGFKYFPFDSSDKRELRAHQGYLTKFPIELFEALAPIGLDAPVTFNSETGQSMARSAQRTHGPRFLTDTKLRMGIERHSVGLTRAWYEERGATSIRELGKPYDLDLVLDRRLRRVEVKGSSMPDISSILLTKNEVRNARAFAETDLVVVDSIAFERDGDGFRFEGGTLRRWENWTPEDMHITGLQYQYELQPIG